MCPLMIHVFLVLTGAWEFAISQSGNIFLTNGLKVSAAANGILSTITAAILTSVEVT